jgi:hypothetical protein
MVDAHVYGNAINPWDGGCALSVHCSETYVCNFLIEVVRTECSLQNEKTVSPLHFFKTAKNDCFKFHSLSFFVIICTQSTNLICCCKVFFRRKKMKTFSKRIKGVNMYVNMSVHSRCISEPTICMKVSKS